MLHVPRNCYSSKGVERSSWTGAMLFLDARSSMGMMTSLEGHGAFPSCDVTSDHFCSYEHQILTIFQSCLTKQNSWYLILS